MQETKLEELKSVSCFAPFTVNSVFLVFSAPETSVGIINTGTNLCVGKWADEESPIHQVNHVIKVTAGEKTDYAVASEAIGLRFIQIVLKKIKGKSKFFFT